MASSRWKRFAFFDKHSLSVPPEVQEDLSLRTIQDDRIQLLVTTAGLPLESKPSTANSNNSSSSSTNNNNDHGDAVQAFWSSLIACSAQDLSAGSSEAQLLTLPRSSHGNSSSSSTTISSVADGLVLGWVTGSDTERVHCFDVTVRCNPPLAIEKDLEDLDGWRGYFAPFSLPAAAVVVGAPVSSPRPDHQHEKNISSSKNNSNNKVVAMAACREHVGSPLHVACVAEKQLVIWEDPHLHLSCRRPFKNQHDVVVSSDDTSNITNWRLQHAWGSNDGLATAVDIRPGMVAVGTSLGAVLIFCYSPSIINDNNKNASRISATLLQTQQLPRRGSIRPYLRIPPPPSDGLQVVSVNLVVEHQRASVFCAYRPQTVRSQSSTPTTSAVGVCCYDMALPSTSNTTLSAPSARHDLDGRIVGSSSLVDASTGQCITVARSDGLYSYSRTERTGVAPMDGTKLAFCFIPPTVGTAERMRRPLQQQTSSDAAGVGYALVASTDAKSGRDAVDIYDVMNKLVAFHLLLSPGHKAVRAAGLTTMPVNCVDGSMKHGRSSALVLTSGGSLITFTEKLTAEKISLLVQKNLYAAAIVIAYADPSFDSVDIAALFREHAEHLYRKGDYAGAMEQYIHTIGSLESSHVIFRYLDAPKIPLLVKYLEKFREQNLATPVHNELLRTCYLKLNDTEAADALTTAVSATLASTGDSSSLSLSSLSSILANLPENPRETLATICSFDAQHVAEILVVHGASLARVLPRETAGVVIALCVGTYSPKALAEASLIDAMSLNKMVERPNDDVHLMHQPYPVHLFTPAFIENPKMLRLILSHCNRNKCYLTPSLRRTLLEVTLDEWNQAKRNGDTELEKLRHKEAITALTDSHCSDIGDYDALVLVHLAGFKEGELLLYERLQMTSMLLERYAKDGSEKSRRALLAMSQTDPEILADVLGHFVDLAGDKVKDKVGHFDNGDDSDDEAEDILEDIQEALAFAKRQGVLPPVRVARILAGEGTGQFSESDSTKSMSRRTVPLSVALDYVGSILEESRKESARLTSEVEEYNQLCNSMENEIDSLLRVSQVLPSSSSSGMSRLNIDETCAKVRMDDSELRVETDDQTREAFWRDMSHSEDTFDTIARYFAKGVM